MQKQISTITGIIIIVAVAVIAVGGVFAYQYYQNSQIPMTNIQSNPNNQIQVKDETADWKTYKNDQYGFEIKYPESNFEQINDKAKVSSDPTFSESNELLRLTHNDLQGSQQEKVLTIHSISIVYIPISYNVFKEKVRNYSKYGITISEFTTYNLGNVQAYNFHFNLNTGIKSIGNIIVIPAGNGVIETGYVKSGGDKIEFTESDLILFNQILSTFKFIK